MNRPLCIGTGWCATESAWSNCRKTSKKMYNPFWLDDWKKYHETQADVSKWVVYVSDCEVYPEFTGSNCDIEMIHSAGNQSLKVHSHDFHASVFMGAAYARCNECDFVYIEQDCLVKGLDKILEFAKGKQLCYGYGKYSLSAGWAEQSLMYVSYDYIPMFLYLGMSKDLMNIDVSRTSMAEVLFHQTFKNVVTPWPFGYGRTRPVNYNDEVLYIQQCTDTELTEMLNLRQ